MTGRFTLVLMVAGILATAQARGQSSWMSGAPAVERTTGEQASGSVTSDDVPRGPYIRFLTQEGKARQERRVNAWRNPRECKTTITSDDEELVAWAEVSRLSADYIRNINGM